MTSDRNDPMKPSPEICRINRRELLGRAAVATAAGALGAMALRPSAARAASAISPSSPTAGFDPGLATLLTNVRFGDNAARQAAINQAPLVGTVAIVPLASVYGGAEPGASKAALEAIQRVVNVAARPGAAAERQSAAESLLSLAQSDRPLPVRADAVRLLGFVGSASEVTALSDLLHVPDLREDARFALERIPGPAAEAALKRASRTVASDYRAAIDQSLRRRKLKPQEIGLRR